jgi:hypothetical protein
MSMIIARLVLWAALGLLIAQVGYTYRTLEFWAVLAIVYALERIVWIEFSEALTLHIIEHKRKHNDNE